MLRRVLAAQVVVCVGGLLLQGWCFRWYNFLSATMGLLCVALAYRGVYKRPAASLSSAATDATPLSPPSSLDPQSDASGSALLFGGAHDAGVSADSVQDAHVYRTNLAGPTSTERSGYLRAFVYT
eukprot:TRINITY_DN65086_c0_g1_i1.p2 TRINITY_DN65086_c0_g1~~TRINITY_DN65086_c0_g1_i1.p2  ORF type:complete len:125 (-),score=42.48 TRINITY_DN65086_c0_g1_i1:219-593(-)